MANRLTKKVGLYFIGNFSSRFLGAALIPIYAFYVSPSALGRYDYILTLAQLLAPIVFMAIWEAALRFLIVDKYADGRDSALSTIVFFSLALSFVTASVSAVVGATLSVDPAGIICLVSIALLYGLVQVWQFLARAEQQTQTYVFSGIVSALITFGLVILLVVVLRLEFAGLVVAYLVGQLAILVIIEVRVGIIRRSSFRTFDSILLKSMLRYSFPLVFNLISVGLLGGFGRILIYNHLGEEANGVYAFAFKFATIIISLGTIVSMSVIEEGLLRSQSSTVGDFYSTVLNALVAVLFLFITALIPICYLFFEVIDDTSYYAARDLAPLLILFAVFSVLSTHFGSVFMTVGKTGPLGMSTLAGALLTVLISILSIDRFGLLGIAIALVTGTFITMLLRLWLSKRQLHYRVRVLPPITLMATYAAVTYLCSISSELIPIWGLTGLAVLILCACLWPLWTSLRLIKDIPDEH